MAPPFRDSEIPEFLAGEPTWRSRLGPEWVGKKLLGKGGHGVVGLWEWKGSKQVIPPAITKVVVKMSECGPELFPSGEAFPKSKIDEGITLLKLSRLKSRHIVRQFGGNRLGERFSEMGEIVRIFLEFCPGGDCDQFLARFGQPAKPPLPEMDLWALFHCMALGIAIIARGTEDVNAPAWGGLPNNTELVHFDIKTDNIFLGTRDQNHSRMPVGKVGDMGEAYEVKAVHLQDDAYGAQASGRGMAYYQPPEETYTDKWSPFKGLPLPSPRKGTCSNIWQIGTVMNQLLIRRQVMFGDSTAAAQCLPSKIDRRNRSLQDNLNHTIDLETPEIAQLYSLPLITLVMECMLRPPLLRPSAIDLVNRTREGLRISTEASSRLRTPPPLPSGMSHIPNIEYKYHETPPEWNVDDTIYPDEPARTPRRSSRLNQAFSPFSDIGSSSSSSSGRKSHASSSNTSSTNSSFFNIAKGMFSSHSSQISTAKTTIASRASYVGSMAYRAGTSAKISLAELMDTMVADDDNDDDDSEVIQPAVPVSPTRGTRRSTEQGARPRGPRVGRVRKSSEIGERRSKRVLGQKSAPGSGR